MKTKKSITLTIVALIVAGIFVSCQQGSNIERRVENKVSDLRDNLNDISEDDSNFLAKLQDELEDFESDMNDIREDINESGEQISMATRQAIDDLQGEARSLRMKIENRTGYADNDRRVMRDRDAISGDRTAQMQRDTTLRDTVIRGDRDDNDGLFGDRNDGPNIMQIDQDLRADFNNFRQNVNQWVDRLSVGTNNNRRDNY
jgi:chromosome segregation ATPase